MAGITAKDFKDYIDDEFDVEILDLLIGIINKRKTFLSKMQDIGNPRMVVKGFQMNKQDLKEYGDANKWKSREDVIDSLVRDFKEKATSFNNTPTNQQREKFWTYNKLMQHHAKLLKKNPSVNEEVDSSLLDAIEVIMNNKVGSARKQAMSVVLDAAKAKSGHSPRTFQQALQMLDLEESVKRRKIIEATSQPIGSEVIAMLHEIASNYKVKVPANKSWTSVAMMVESVYLSVPKSDRSSFIKDIQKLKAGTCSGEIIL